MFYYKAKVLRCVDADTLDLQIDIGFDIAIYERVRLYGLDAPETRTRDKEEKIRGFESKDYVISQLARVKGEIEIQTHKDKKGKFGRYLVEIFYQPEGYTSRINLNAALIKKGLAVPYWGGVKK